MLTKHVCTRAQQRGISQASLYLVQRYGTETPDGIIMTRKNIAAVERETKDLLDRLSKLDGVFVATDGDIVKTTFHATKRQFRKQSSGNR